ncbi:MAG TPA: hypothetical protein VGL80_10640 [Pseudonocardiaceae bacterium]
MRHGWCRPGPAPDVVDRVDQVLARCPRAQDTWRVGSPPLPAGQGVLHGQLVAAQQQDVDVTVHPKRASDGEFDGVAAGHPPGHIQTAEDRLDGCGSAGSQLL